jgi:hypothetical protein
MAQANTDNSITAPAVSTRRRFLSQAAGVAAGGAVLGMALPMPVPAAALERVPDPILEAIEEHKKARSALREAEAAHALAEREMQASGALFPRVVSIGNAYSGLPRPVSTSHADIDMFTPADMFPQDNKREHEELSAAISRRDARIVPVREAMDDAWIAEREVLEELVETVPTTIAGVLAMLKFLREYWEGDGDFMDADMAANLGESVETALLNLQSRGWQGVGMVS